MKTRPGIFLAALLIPVVAVPLSQAQAAAKGDGGTSEVAVRDGGVSQILQSIYLPTLLNAPFTATVHTEWIRSMPEGGSFTLVNQRRIARDSLGRIYEERWWLVPKNGRVQSRMNLIQIGDPNAHTLYNCYLLEQPRRCILETFVDKALTAYAPTTGKSGPLPNDAGFSTHEDLGTRSIDGIDTVGTRDTVTYNEGVYGNDRPLVVRREFWNARSLGINLYSELSDPRFGRQVFTVSDVSFSEPDPKLFELPEGFAVVDRRKPAAPQE